MIRPRVKMIMVIWMARASSTLEKVNARAGRCTNVNLQNALHESDHFLYEPTGSK